MNSQIEKLKNELDIAVNNSNSTMEDLIDISHNIDTEIQKTYKNKISKEDIQKLLEETEQSKSIMINIKSDLLDHYYNISLIDLGILSQDIYDYCYLIVNDIPEQEIISYIAEQNEKYYKQLSVENMKNMRLEFNINYFKTLISKYTKILKSNKQS